MIGFAQQVGGTAAEYVESIKGVCDAVSPHVLNEVTNTMTDRCSTNDAVDRQLEEQRNIKVNKFRCSMHPLDSFARDANKALKRLDVNKERTCKMPFNKGGECNAQAFIRVASKLFTSDSCGDFFERERISSTDPQMGGQQIQHFVLIGWEVASNWGGHCRLFQIGQQADK